MLTVRSGTASGTRVLLVNTNRERQPYPVMPNGLAAIGSALHRAAHTIGFLDLCFVRDPVRMATDTARSFHPDVIGVAVRNIDNSDAIALRHYTPAAAAVVDALRTASAGTPILAGGAAFGVAPEALFRELRVDMAVAGDGERASVAVVDALAAGAPVDTVADRSPIAGVVRRVGERIHFTPPAEEADLDSLPPADLPAWTNVARYERHGATMPIQTKRGCVYRCVYCTYRNVEGWGYRLREPALVAEEIVSLRRRGVRHFDFVDSTFNSPPGHALAICEAIASRALPVHLDTTNFTPAVAPDDLLTAMRRAGFRTVGISAESASDPVLDRLQKGFDAAKVWETAERLRHAGLRALWIFLVGGPGETPASLAETLRFAESRLRRGDAVYATVGLRIYPGTTLHRIALEEGVVGKDDSLLTPSFYCSPSLPFDHALRELATFASAHPRFMFSADSQSAILPYLTRLAALIRLPRPHWQHMAIFQRFARLVA